MENTINLTKEEYEKIKREKKKLGSGVDGTIYGMDSKTAFKFYHSTTDYIYILDKGIYDSNGVNIRSPKELNTYTNRINKKPINYIDYDNVILSREEAIRKAIEKQKYVKYTNLPQKIIKVDNRLVGCVYKRYKSIMGIYALSLMSLNTRKKVLRKLFTKLQELHNNCIYPVTLAQKNDLLPFSKKDSNVLLSITLDPNFVDLDGISAIYSDIFCQYEYERSLNCFSHMAFEILTGIDLKPVDDEIELDCYIHELAASGLPEETIIDFYSENGFKDEERIIKLLK